MDQVEKSENYQALSIIIGEQQRQMSQVSACDPRAAIESARGGFSIAADQYLSQTVAVLSSPNPALEQRP